MTSMTVAHHLNCSTAEFLAVKSFNLPDTVRSCEIHSLLFRSSRNNKVGLSVAYGLSLAEQTGRNC